ncbi:MAG: hypothetical protein CMF50_08030 [Legionellales bacterium]|nr:hypothetical protein [Legionellales bacterium]|tara:strand:- start:7094 stop:8416 length:1323 start_codon:yes stop_codon:yes gene_type:complete
MAYVNEVRWPDIAAKVQRLNPELANLLDDLPKSQQLPLFIATYPYGFEIINSGRFYLPNKTGNIVPLDDDSIPKRQQKALNYNFGSNPVFILMNKSTELYLAPREQQSIPYKIFTAGDIVGTWGILDNDLSLYHPANVWGMTAGARSTFMLPPISHKTFHARLQNTYGIKAPAPANLHNHWHVFRELYQKVPERKPWEVSLLLFSADWFKSLDKPAFQPLKLYLLEQAWQSSNYLRNHALWDFVFSVIKKHAREPIESHIYDIIKHCYSVALGQEIAFEPLTHEDTLPLSLIQTAYVDGPYQLKSYTPTIMGPKQFSRKKPVYISPYHLTTLEFSGKRTKRRNLMAELTAIEMGLEQVRLTLDDPKLAVKDTLLYRVIADTVIEFFHYLGLDQRPNLDIANEDKRFDYATNAAFCGDFPYQSEFAKGCIRIATKKNPPWK